MFGGIWALISSIAVLIDSIKGDSKDEQLRQNAIDQNLLGFNTDGTYYDHKGEIRDVFTNKKVIISNDPNTGDKVVYDLKFNVIRNLTQERIKRLENLAKNSNQTSVMIKIQSNNYSVKANKVLKKDLYYHEVKGEIYKDLKTGELYANRYFSWNSYDDILIRKIVEATGINPENILPSKFHGCFFMRIDNGLLERISDKEYTFDKKINIKDYENFIKYFNEYRKGIPHSDLYNIGHILREGSSYEERLQHSKIFDELFYNSIKYLHG